MSELRGIVRRSSSGTNIIRFPVQPTQCVAAPDPRPRAARSRLGKTSTAYRISQIVAARAEGEDDTSATKIVWAPLPSETDQRVMKR